MDNSILVWGYHSFVLLFLFITREKNASTTKEISQQNKPNRVGGVLDKVKDTEQFARSGSYTPQDPYSDPPL